MKKKVEEIVGGPIEDGESYSGTRDTVEMVGELLRCHDRRGATKAAPGTRRVKLEADVDHMTERPGEVPAGSTLNHDSVTPTVSYEIVRSFNDDELARVPKEDFGVTGGRIKLSPVNWEAPRGTDVVFITSRLLHRVGWSVTDRPGRTDVPADLSTINEQNWREAADDLDPEVHKTLLGAPRREKFWVRDQTVAHEQFHVDDSDRHVREVVTPMIQAFIAQHEIDVPLFFYRDTNVKAQVDKIMLDAAVKAIDERDAYMSKPASEIRAYAADDAGYRAKAKAIRDKAQQEGWTKKKKK